MAAIFAQAAFAKMIAHRSIGSETSHVNTFQGLRNLGANLVGLGPRRLAALGIVGAIVFGAVAISSYLLGRSGLEVLYVGLEARDASRMAAVLSDAGIEFDVSADSTRLMVRRGREAEARALLAERGLPNSTTSGYELFDKIGPLGMTSFMQEVTRVRALEGEIARSIQGMRGIVAARVHVVLGSPATFKRTETPPSASVVLRTEKAGDMSSVQAVRHLVAAAVPGLSAENVQVVGANGELLASGQEGAQSGANRLVEFERELSKDLQNNIRRTLSPHLGLDNFEVSVAVRLNVDKRQVSETEFDPKSKVERSVRVVKEAGSAENSAKSDSVSVEQNIPAEDVSAAGQEGSKRSNQRREELINYEIGSRQIATVTDGYRVESIAVAVVLNRKQLAQLGIDPADQAGYGQRMKEFEQLVGTAAGIDTNRGDRVTIAALDFTGSPAGLGDERGVLDRLLDHTSSIVTALAMLAAIGLALAFGVRPAMRAMQARSEEPTAPGLAAAMEPAMLGAAPGAALAETVGDAMFARSALSGADGDGQDYAAGLTSRRSKGPQSKLEQMFDLDPEQAAVVVQRWVREASVE